MEESLKTTFEEFRKFAAEDREYTDAETGVKSNLKKSCVHVGGVIFTRPDIWLPKLGEGGQRQ